MVWRAAQLKLDFHSFACVALPYVVIPVFESLWVCTLSVVCGLNPLPGTREKQTPSTFNELDCKALSVITLKLDRAVMKFHLP
jgi:hypothetical protein